MDFSLRAMQTDGTYSLEFLNGEDEVTIKCPVAADGAASCSEVERIGFSGWLVEVDVMPSGSEGNMFVVHVDRGDNDDLGPSFLALRTSFDDALISYQTLGRRKSSTMQVNGCSRTECIYLPPSELIGI